MSPKYLFFNDYSEGAHPNILEALRSSNMDQELGYGLDRISEEARRLIRDRLATPDVDVHFVSGGTQANLVVLSAILKPFESVIAPESAHINIHEAGAVEATGHKIHEVQDPLGKLSVKAVRQIVARHNDEHMVKPRVAFVSQATEAGTIYSKEELTALSRTCKEAGLYLYLDGARLGTALTAAGADLSFEDIPKLADIFYIGGTKNGALLGEALVIVNAELKDCFRRQMKQRGALLAKGRVLGAQFAELFKGTLYLDLARHANQLAAKLAAGIAASGYSFLYPPATNQLFPILPNRVIDHLKEQFGFYVWSPIDDGCSVIRLVTSWATTEEAVEQLLRQLASHSKPA